MRRDLFSVAPDASLAEIECELSRRRISGAPVVEGERLVGVISRADIVRQLGVSHVLSELAAEYYSRADGLLEGAHAVRSEDRIAKVVDEGLGRQLRSLRARDAMSDDPVTVTPETSVAEVARTMLERRVHRVIVVTDGRPVGLIASLDLLSLLAQQ